MPISTANPIRCLASYSAIALAITAAGQAQETDGTSLTNAMESVQEAVENTERMYQHDFDVTIESPQLNGLLQKEATGGAQLPARIDRLGLSHRNGDSSFKAKVAGLPPQFQTQVEQFLNAKLGQSKIGTMWSKATTDFLNIAREEVDKGAELKIAKETDTTRVLVIEGLDREFYKDLHLNAIRLTLDKKEKLISGARLYLTDAKDLTLAIKYESVELEGEDTPLPVWSHVRIEQNSWMGTLFGFLGWPNKVNVDFKDYQFIGSKK